MHTERTSCRDEGKDQGDISTSQGQQSPRSCERGPGTGSPSEPRKESTLLTSSSWISRLQNCEATNFCCVSTSSWWYLVMVALANYISSLLAEVCVSVWGCKIFRNYHKNKNCSNVIAYICRQLFIFLKVLACYFKHLFLRTTTSGNWSK